MSKSGSRNKVALLLVNLVRSMIFAFMARPFFVALNQRDEKPGQCQCDKDSAAERDKKKQRPQDDLAARGKGHWGADGVHGHDFLNSPTAFANSTTADTAD